jgi:hypothetical protein
MEGPFSKGPSFDTGDITAMITKFSKKIREKVIMDVMITISFVYRGEKCHHEGDDNQFLIIYPRKWSS